MLSWSRKWQPTPVLLPGKSCGQRSLAGYSPRGHKESDMTECARTQALYYAEAFDEVLWATQNSATDELSTEREDPLILPPTPDSRQQPGRTGQLPLRTGI